MMHQRSWLSLHLVLVTLFHLHLWLHSSICVVHVEAQFPYGEAQLPPFPYNELQSDTLAPQAQSPTLLETGQTQTQTQTQTQSPWTGTVPGIEPGAPEAAFPFRPPPLPAELLTKFGNQHRPTSQAAFLQQQEQNLPPRELPEVNLNAPEEKRGKDGEAEEQTENGHRVHQHRNRHGIRVEKLQSPSFVEEERQGRTHRLGEKSKSTSTQEHKSKSKAKTKVTTTTTTTNTHTAVKKAAVKANDEEEERDSEEAERGDEAQEESSDEPAASLEPLNHRHSNSHAESQKNARFRSKAEAEVGAEESSESTAPVPISPPLTSESSGAVSQQKAAKNQPLQDDADPLGGQSPAYFSCRASGGSHGTCVVKFPPNSVQWSVRMVERNSLRGSSSESSSGSESSGSNNPVSSGYGMPQLSSNPEIANVQRDYIQKFQQLQKEKAWIAQVRQIINDYQVKVRNVQANTVMEARDLQQQKRNIMDLLRQDRERKLEQELQGALAALRKLEDSSSNLNGKVKDIINAKMGLQGTIQRIQAALGKSGRSLGANNNNGNQVFTVPITTTRFAERFNANKQAKQLFSSLLELLDQQQQRHHSHEEEHNRAQERNLEQEVPLGDRLENKADEDATAKLLAHEEVGSPEFEKDFNSIISESEKGLDD